MTLRNAIAAALLASMAVLLSGSATAQEMACQGTASTSCTPDEGWIRGPEGAMWARFEWVDGKPVYQGDIVVEVLPAVSGDAVLKSAIVAGPIDTWPEGVIPYVVDSTLPSQGRVVDAVSHWNGEAVTTGVTLVPRTTQTDYVRFTPADGCWSYVGRTGGVQEIGLASGCYTGAVIHEIGHAAGLWHEQSRDDRDGYVTIQWDNIDQGHQGNFEKYSTGYGADAGPYDYDSIMHYSAYAFSANGQPTIVPTQAGAVIGQRDGLSQGDLGGIATLYGDDTGNAVSDLQNGVPVGNLDRYEYDEAHFRLHVPAGVDELTFETSGGIGFAMLFVKHGSQPTMASYDCRYQESGTNHTCSFDSPGAGEWYVMLKGWCTFEDVALVGSYQGGGGKAGVIELQNGVPAYGLAGSPNDELYFRLQVPAGVDELSFETSGGSGDADLYVKRGALPTTLSYDCRPWMDGNDESCSFNSPSGGDWYVMIRGYSSFSGVVLVGSYQENAGGGGISEWMGHSVFKASAKKLGKRSWEGTSQMVIEGNGSFTYIGPKGTTLTGPVSQDGKKLYMALDNGSIQVLEEELADLVWDEMTLRGLNPGWVDVDIDPSSIKLKAKLVPGKNGNRSSIKLKLSAKAWIDTGIGSSKGKLQAKMTLYEP